MKEFLHDRWAGLSHIPDIGDGYQSRPPGHMWVTLEDWRRLQAYRILAALRENVRRYWLPPEMWQKAGTHSETRIETKADAEGWREYGHAALLVQTARSLVLGSDQTPIADSDAPVQAWLTEWASKERLQAQLVVAEEHAIGDGDAVLTLTWSSGKQRPKLRIINPGFYFPDLASLDTVAGWEDEDMPPVVHLGWERTDRDNVVWLRQTTWRMVRLDADADPGLPTAPVSAVWGGRREWTCVYSVTDYRLDRLRGDKTSIYDLEPTNPAAVSVVAPTDLLIDFIPLVHVPNTPAGGYHFGASLLTGVAQILDDLAGSDTDVSATAQSSAAPAAVFTGAGAARDMPGGPQASWWGPEGSGMGYTDTSRVLTAGLAQNENLLRHLAVNSRLGVALLGRVAPDEVPSGFALQLGFAPAQSMMREMRLVRAEKYPLLLKMAVRLAQVGGVLPSGPTPPIELDLGSGLPSDLATTVEAIAALLPIGAVSVDTAVRWLMAQGVPIVDAETEVAAILAAQTEKAVELVEATGDVDAARARLGLPDAVPLPAPVIDPGGNP
jgi:hypothetical protein